MRKTTQKECRAYIADGIAIDLKTCDDATLRAIGSRGDVVAMGYGVYGMNCGIFSLNGQLYATPKRSVELFAVAR